MADDKIFDAKDLLGDFKKETEKAKQEVAKELQEVGKSIIADVKAMRQDVKKQVESQQKLVGKIEADIDVVLNSDNISDKSLLSSAIIAISIVKPLSVCISSG